jgi:hypothetical protein
MLLCVCAIAGDENAKDDDDEHMGADWGVVVTDGFDRMVTDGAAKMVTDGAAAAFSHDFQLAEQFADIRQSTEHTNNVEQRPSQFLIANFVGSYNEPTNDLQPCAIRVLNPDTLCQDSFFSYLFSSSHLFLWLFCFLSLCFFSLAKFRRVIAELRRIRVLYSKIFMDTAGAHSAVKLGVVEPGVVELGVVI